MLKIEHNTFFDAKIGLQNEVRHFPQIRFRAQARRHLDDDGHCFERIVAQDDIRAFRFGVAGVNVRFREGFEVAFLFKKCLVKTKACISPS